MEKKRSAGTVFVGFIVIALAIAGLVAIITQVSENVQQKAKEKEVVEFSAYEDFISTIIMNDPDTFDDITKANMQQLISISIWSVLGSDIEPDTFEYGNDGMLLMPQTMVEDSFKNLFGTELKIVHSLVDGGDGVQFAYSENQKCYLIPITGITPIYIPKITDAKEKGGSVVLTVGYLSTSDWQQGADGDMVPPEPSKIMKITLGKNTDGSFYVRAIQNADT